MAMPAQKPGYSEQVVGTPSHFLAAVERRFGDFMRFDLAANADNHVCSRWLGPGSELGEDSLAVEWAEMGVHGWCWLNPPFGKIGPWARKCAIEGSLGAQILMLVPAAIGSNWFRDYVQGQALVIPLAPRLTFVGHTDPYPRDLILCAYGPTIFPGFAHQWRWNVHPKQQHCMKCGGRLADVPSFDGKAVARQCQLCHAYALPKGAVGAELPPKKAPRVDERRVIKAAAKAKAERQLGLFVK